MSIQDRWKITGLSQSGIRQKDIAAQIGCSIPTVIRIVRAYREEGEDIAILASSSRDPFKTATDLKRELGLAA
ncbi:helix-turn-helix domain-containing protein, partial [Bradyrhizobium sp. 33ap4]|uniref:helix-turn-helix domain-containing protein n=1 Tax=Bradyrhizobium sp. 33ap4 TaxID=3061630 RepID=UPI002931AF21